MVKELYKNKLKKQEKRHLLSSRQVKTRGKTRVFGFVFKKRQEDKSFAKKIATNFIIKIWHNAGTPI